MSRFITLASTCLISVAFAASAQAAAPPLTKAQKVAVKQAIVACKAEAKGKKIAWLSRRKYVNGCVAQALKEHPTIDNWDSI
jgi:hypothetical protein